MTSERQYIIISGIDGAGKTSIIEKLMSHYEAEGLTPFYIWMRYNHIIVKPVHALCRLVGLSRRIKTKQGKRWHHEFYRSQLFCSLYFCLVWLDTWLGKWKMAWLLRRQPADIVICDRWVGDILIDLATDSLRTNLLDSTWYYRFMRILPKNTIQYLIVRNTEDVLKCRIQNREDPQFCFRQNMYQLLSHKTDEFATVYNDGTISDVVDRILLPHQHS